MQGPWYSSLYFVLHWFKLVWIGNSHLLVNSTNNSMHQYTSQIKNNWPIKHNHQIQEICFQFTAHSHECKQTTVTAV